MYKIIFLSDIEIVILKQYLSIVCEKNVIKMRCFIKDGIVKKLSKTIEQ